MAAHPKIFMGLALIHFQENWLLSKLTYQFDIYLHSNYYWLNIKGCAYQRTNFSMSKLSKSLCNVLASQISHQKQPWSEKILQMSEMYKIWIQNTTSSGWTCQVISYDKGQKVQQCQWWPYTSNMWALWTSFSEKSPMPRKRCLNYLFNMPKTNEYKIISGPSTIP